MCGKEEKSTDHTLADFQKTLQNERYTVLSYYSIEGDCPWDADHDKQSQKRSYKSWVKKVQLLLSKKERCDHMASNCDVILVTVCTIWCWTACKKMSHNIHNKSLFFNQVLTILDISQTSHLSLGMPQY